MNRDTGKKIVIQFPTAEDRAEMWDKDRMPAMETLVSFTVASNLFAQFGIVAGDIIIADTARNAKEGEIVAYEDASDDAGAVLAHYCEKKRKGRKIIASVVGFHRYFRDEKD